MATPIERSGLFRNDCPYRAEKPSISMRWSSVGFAHWAFEPNQVARILPANLRADLYGGKAWVGYQFLSMTPTADSILTRLPQGMSKKASFSEMRLQVCVIDTNDMPGLYLLSVDNNQSAVIRWQRRVLNLPTFHADISNEVDQLGGLKAPGSVVDYRCLRSDGTTARLKIRITGSRAETDVDRFLTARWRIQLPARFWADANENRWVLSVHEPWQLQRASMLAVDEDALLAAGLPAPDSQPVTLWSPGATVHTSTPKMATRINTAATAG